MAKIIPFRGVTKLDLDPEVVLRNLAEEADLEGVVVLGWRRDGSEFFSSTYADGGTVLWLLERLKQQLLKDPDT